MSDLFEEGLVQFVPAVPAIQNLIATRMYPNRAPDKAPTPFIVYTKVSGARDLAHDGNAGFGNPRYQFSCWSADYTQAKKLAAELVKLFHLRSGTIGSFLKVASFVEDDPDKWDTESRLTHVPVDVKFWLTEPSA